METRLYPLEITALQDCGFLPANCLVAGQSNTKTSASYECHDVESSVDTWTHQLRKTDESWVLQGMPHLKQNSALISTYLSNNTRCTRNGVPNSQAKAEGEGELVYFLYLFTHVIVA